MQHIEPDLAVAVSEFYFLTYLHPYPSPIPLKSCSSFPSFLSELSETWRQRHFLFSSHKSFEYHTSFLTCVAMTGSELIKKWHSSFLPAIKSPFWFLKIKSYNKTQYTVLLWFWFFLSFANAYHVFDTANPGHWLLTSKD